MLVLNYLYNLCKIFNKYDSKLVPCGDNSHKEEELEGELESEEDMSTAEVY